jgi:hypothetical protein
LPSPLSHEIRRRRLRFSDYARFHADDYQILQAAAHVASDGSPLLSKPTPKRQAATVVRFRLMPPLVFAAEATPLAIADVFTDYFRFSELLRHGGVRVTPRYSPLFSLAVYADCRRLAASS